MGDVAFIADRMSYSSLRDGSNVVVIASAAETQRLAPMVAGSALPDLRILAVDSDQPVPAGQLDQALLLILEVDPASPGSMQRLAAVHDSYPQLALVAAIRNPTVALVRTLMRQGVADVVALPLDTDEMLQVSLDAVARRGADIQQAAVLAPLVSVVRSVGGCGATTIATHLAAALGETDPAGKDALIADLDIQFGTVTDYLGVTPRGRLSDLLEAHDRLDDDLLRSVAMSAADRLAVVAAPDAIQPLERIDIDQLLKVIQLFRRQYGSVVLDLPADWTNWTLSLATASDAIVMVVELSLPSLRQAKRRLDLFRSVGIEDRAVQVVVNRAEKKLFGSIDLDDVAKTLGHAVLGSVALDHPLVGAAQNQGQLVGAMRGKSPFVRDIAKIADLLRAGPLARRP